MNTRTSTGLIKCNETRPRDITTENKQINQDGRNFVLF